MKKIVCHGDSLTEAVDIQTGYSWTTLVENQLSVRVINSGIGGDTSTGLLGRFYHDVVRHKPSIVFIMAGTNDVWWDVDMNTIQANIFAMTCQAQYHDIAPIVGLPLPMLVKRAKTQDFMAPVAGYATCEKKITQLVANLADAAAKNDIPCLDFHHPFLDKKGNPLGRYYLDDGLHPNKDGQKLMAKQAVGLIRKHFYLD